MADPVVPFAQGQDAAAQAAIQANLTYRAVNNPETLTPAEQAYLSNKVVSPTQGIISQSQDAANEAAKQQAAFSQPRTDTREVTSPEGRAIIAQYAAQHPGWTEKPIQYEKSAAGIAAELAGSGGAIGEGLRNRAISEGYSGPTYAPSAERGVVNVLLTPTTRQSEINMESFVGRNVSPTRDYSSSAPISYQMLSGGDQTRYTLQGPVGIGTIKNLTFGFNPLTGEAEGYQMDKYGNRAVVGIGRYGMQSGEFTLTSEKTGKTINLETLSPFWTENLSKAEAPGANIPYTVSKTSPGLFTFDSSGVLKEYSFPGEKASLAHTPSTQVKGMSSEIIPTSSVGITEISTGVFTTGEITYIGSSGRLPVVAGSYKSETITKPGEASLSNFATNLYGNVVNTLGGLVGFSPNLETTKGFAETITKEEYQVSLPQAFVSEAPKAYVATPIIMDMRTVTTEKEASLYETYNVQLSSAIPKLPTEMTFAAARGEYNAIDSVAIGAYEKASTRPLDVIKYADIGALIVIGGGAIGGGVSTLAAGTRAAPIVAAVGEAAPGFFGTLYGYSVAERSTEGFKDFSTASATRFGGIASTEAIPMLAGGVFAARPAIGYEALSAVERALPDIQQRTVAGTPITRDGPELISTALPKKSTALIPIKPITIETGRAYIVESTKVISPQYGDITLSIEKSIVNIGREGKISRVSTAEDILINPNQLSAVIDKEYSPRIGTFGSTKVTEIIASKDVYGGSGKQYTFDIARSSTVHKPEAFDYATPMLSAERILSEPAKAPSIGSLKLAPEDIAGITTEYARVYSPETGFAVTRVERIPASERLKFETGRTTEVTDLGSVPDYLRSGAILEANSRALMEVGVVTKTAVLEGETKTIFDITAPSEKIHTEMFGPESAIFPSYEAALKSRTIPKETHDIRVIKDIAKESDKYYEELLGGKTVKSKARFDAPRPTTPIVNKRFKSDRSEPTKTGTSQITEADALATEKAKSISVALEQLREPVKKAEPTTEVKSVSRSPIFAEYAPRRTLVLIEEEQLSTALPSGITRPASASLETRGVAMAGSVDRASKSASMSEATQSIKQSVDQLTRIEQATRTSQDRVRTPIDALTQYGGKLPKTDVTIKQEQKVFITPFTSTTVTPKTTTETTPKTTPDIMTDISKEVKPDSPPPPPPPPIPIVRPVWNPGQGGYATGTKRYRRKVQIETSAYLPNFVEKESMKFFRAAGNGKIASASPTGKVTITSYQKKSRRK